MEHDELLDARKDILAQVTQVDSSKNLIDFTSLVERYQRLSLIHKKLELSFARLPIYSFLLSHAASLSPLVVYR